MNWLREVVANILDPIHDTLSPHVWDKPESDLPKLKPEHRHFIITEVRRLAEKFHPDPEAWLSLVLTGSLTTYQYSEGSDCDISLFVDHNVLPDWDRAKLIGLMVAEMDGHILPGTPYPMQCFVVAPEIHKDDLYQHGLRSGYDIEQDKWLVPPDPTRVSDVEREYNAYYVYALESADKMERLLKYDPDRAVQFWHQIHKRRQRDQRLGKGDFSESNIVYKFLANRDLFPAISQASGEYIAKQAARPDWLPYQYNIRDEVVRYARPAVTGEVIGVLPNGQVQVRWQVRSPYDRAITTEDPSALKRITNNGPQQQKLFASWDF